MFPMADIDVEQHTPLGTMDPVFNPQITRLSDGFLAKAYAEIEAMGGTDGPLKAKYAFLEKVLDIKSSPAYRNDTTAFGQFPSSVHFEVGKEPMMTGGLKMACSASDALTLQYYEEPDAVNAGFGHKLSEREWAEVSSVKDWYQDVLFAAPSVAANVAHPMLRELLAELRTPGRKFAFLCGHDSNIASVLASLGVEDYTLPETIEPRTPIGCKLVFERWLDGAGEAFWKVSLVYQSTDQLREYTRLTLENPPVKTALAFDGVETNADGMIAEADLFALFDGAIDAYDALLERYCESEELPSAA
jgi:glucose-1-phosphatase